MVLFRRCTRSYGRLLITVDMLAPGDQGENSELKRGFGWLRWNLWLRAVLLALLIQVPRNQSGRRARPGDDLITAACVLSRVRGAATQ